MNRGVNKHARIVSLLMVGVLLTFGAPLAKTASADSGTWKSAQFNVSVSWSDPWVGTKQVSTSGAYDLLQLTAATASASREAYGIVSTETDPRVITHKFVERFRSKIAYTITQEWENCRCSGSHPMGITFRSSSGVQMIEAIDGWSIDPGKSVYVGVFSHPTDSDGMALRALDRKISFNIPPARPQDIPPPVLTPTQSAVVSTAAASASCAGYPAWRAQVVNWVQTITQARTILASGGPPNTQVAPAQVAASEAAGLLDPLLNELLHTTAPPIAAQAELALGQAVSAYDNANVVAGDPPFQALLAEMTRLDAVCKSG